MEKLQAELEMYQKLAERHNQETVDHLRKINAIEEETADLITKMNRLQQLSIARKSNTISKRK